MHRNEVVDLQKFRDAETAGSEIDVEDTQNLPAGTRLLLGQYVIDDYLNCGGFGITYTARDSLGRKVVIKECFPADMVYRRGKSMAPRSPKFEKELQAIVRSFVTEAHNLATVKHDNIVHVHQIFEENNTAYLAMDFIDGMDLLEIVETKRRLPPKQIEALTRKMLDAIGYIHAIGMLHRDISPDNILIDRSGDPVLIDFGAARSHAQQTPRGLGKMKFVKDGYSPQEFYVAGSAQGTFSDLYSFAASIYHVISGSAPVDAQTRMAAIAARNPDPYKPLVGRVTGFSPRFLKAIDMALSVAPEDRIQTAEDWLARIPAGRRSAASIVFKPASAVLESFSFFDDLPNAATDGALGANRRLMAAGVAGLALALGAGVFLMRSGDDANTPLQVTEAAAVEVEPTPSTLARLANVASPEPLVSVWPEQFSPGFDAGSSSAEALPGAAADAAPPVLAEVAMRRAPVIAVPDINQASAVFGRNNVAAIGSVSGMDIATQTDGTPALVPQAAGADLPGVAAPRPPGKAPMTMIEAANGNQMYTGQVDVQLASIAPVSLSQPVAALPSPPEDSRVVVDTIAPVYTPRESTAPVESGYSRWEVAMPFTSRATKVGEATGMVVTEIAPGADLSISGDWIAKDVIILAVNDMPLVEGMSMSRHVLNALQIDPDGQARVNVWYRKPSEQVLDQAVLTVPVIRKTELADGTVLETRMQGESWVTSVTALGSADTDLAVGDLIVGNSTTNTRFADHQAVEAALDALAQSGASAAEFAVLRNGQRLTAAWEMAGD